MRWALPYEETVRLACMNRSRRIPVEYFMLLKPRPDGPAVGFYAGQEIASAVIDADGRRYLYAGVAPRLLSGRYDVDALREDEWLVEPGLVYCGERTPDSGLLAKMRRTLTRDRNSSWPD